MDILSQKILLVSGLTFIFIITIFLLILATGIIMLVLVYQKKQLQSLREKEQLKVTFEKELLESKLEIQEQTFKNISQEIHDNIGQVLSLVKLNINTMDGNKPETLQNKIDDSRDLITKAIQDLRDLSKSLNTDYVNESGLVQSVEYELGIIKKTGNYNVVFEVEGEMYRMESQKELIIFRIVQEALHNIIKHANASTLAIQFIYEPERFSLKIKDDGTGFDTTQLDLNNYNGLGLGLRNIHNRANIIHADFKLISNLEKGTTVFLTVPLNNTNS